MDIYENVALFHFWCMNRSCVHEIFCTFYVQLSHTVKRTQKYSNLISITEIKNVSNVHKNICTPRNFLEYSKTNIIKEYK